MNIEQRQSRKTSSPLVEDLLHAIGQPLTSLQMCVLLRDRASFDTRDVATLMHEMADQVSVLSRLFEILRRVLDAEPAPRITLNKLERLLPQWQQAALQRKITILTAGLQAVEVAPPGRVHRDVTEICLQEIIAAALQSTPDQGSITIALIPQPSPLPCQLQITGGTLLAESSFPGHFALRAAKTLLDASNQEFTFRLNPFLANLVLPAPAPAVADAAAIDQVSANLYPAAGKDQGGLPG